MTACCTTPTLSRTPGREVDPLRFRRVPYTNFHPIYKGKCGMSGGRVEGKVIYETQSTHKLLAAFSQASMIHVKG